MSPGRGSRSDDDRDERGRESEGEPTTFDTETGRSDHDGHDDHGDRSGRGDRSDHGRNEAGGHAEDAKAEGEGDGGAGNEGRRDVVVPRELYKVVTVFSTLIAIGAVVAGFIALDTATNRTLAAASEVNLPLAALGVFLIVLGAAVYAFASRFRTQGMGSPNNDADEGTDNG